jgi:hypothetical protein
MIIILTRACAIAIKNKKRTSDKGEAKIQYRSIIDSEAIRHKVRVFQVPRHINNRLVHAFDKLIKQLQGANACGHRSSKSWSEIDIHILIESATEFI